MYPKDMGMTGREGPGCISPLHSIIQLQRDQERSGEGGEGGGASPLDHGFQCEHQFGCCLCTNSMFRGRRSRFPYLKFQCLSS